MLKLVVAAVLLAVAQASLKCDIQLRVDCAPFAGQPVCADNGVTYGSACEKDKAACTLKTTFKTIFQGTCEDAVKDECKDDYIQKNVQCTDADLPLCGSDGKTYINKCEFHMSRCAAYAKYGPNRAPAVHIRVMGRGCEDPTTRRPYNVCLDHWAKQDCDSQRVTAFTKVCDNKGNTYGNRCFFSQAKCNDDSLTQKYCRPGGL